MKKFILALFSLIILSGCSANISLNIDDKNNVTEKAYLFEKNDIVQDSGMTKEEFLNSSYEILGSDSFMNYVHLKKYNNEDFGMEFSKETKGVCNAFKTSAFSDFFDKLDCFEKKNYYEIKAKSNYMIYSINEEELPTINNITIEVQLPESAISSDADIVEGNKYIWKYTKDNVATFNLKIKKYKTDSINIIKVETSNINIWIVLGVVLIIILVVSGILFIKYRKNKLQY